MRITTRLLALAITLVVTTVSWSQEQQQSSSPSPRARVVILSDFPPLDVQIDSGPASRRSDPDDIQSMVRFLLYANDLEVVGLVASSATFANIAKKQNLMDILDHYDAVDENLQKHDTRYPSAAELRSVTWQGASGSYGQPADKIIGTDRDSEASEKIIALLKDTDTRPVWFCVWGGPCDLAQALWKIKETYSEAEAQRLISKARVYLIGRQDGTAQWLLDTFPQLFVIAADKTWLGIFETQGLRWVDANVRHHHGPLGEVYPPVGMGTQPGIKEGDSPSFLYLVSAARGLNNAENPDQSSWGGRFVRMNSASQHWTDHSDGGMTVRQWSQHFDNDFAARMDWCVKEVDQANHPPIIDLKNNGPSRHFQAKVGDHVTIMARLSDPDGNKVSYRWWKEHSSKSDLTELKSTGEGAEGSVGFVVPDTNEKQFFVILEATDDGSPPLVSYQRFEVNLQSTVGDEK